MDTHIDVEKFDIQKFAESLVRAGREGVKWSVESLNGSVRRRQSSRAVRATLLE